MALFVTGATGFLGRRLLQVLDAAGAGPVLCLARTPSALPKGSRAVPGDLLDPSSYRAALAGCGTVVHLAAVTGKASLPEHRRVNAEGTRVLLDACRDAGVRRFVHVSTIAVTYPDLGAYAYALTKAEAEAHVRASGLDFAIVRPTVVLGPGSPLAAKFRALATAPAMIVLGTGRTRMSPVHVGDVAECLEWLARCEPLGGRTFGLGGRDVLTVEELLRRIRAALGGREGSVVRVPIRLAVAGLVQLQKVALPFLPVTAGQFYAFLYDSVPAPAEGIVPAPPDRRGVDDIIADQWASHAVADTLAAEADALCRYLVGGAPSEYARRKYVEAHAGPGSPALSPSFDDFLVAYARRGPLQARLADAWSAVFSRSGTFRRKLVLLLAILESSAETSRLVDHPDEGSDARFVAEAALRLLAFPVLVAAAAVWLGPRRLAYGGRAR